MTAAEVLRRIEDAAVAARDEAAERARLVGVVARDRGRSDEWWSLPRRVYLWATFRAVVAIALGLQWRTNRRGGETDPMELGCVDGGQWSAPGEPTHYWTDVVQVPREWWRFRYCVENVGD